MPNIACPIGTIRERMDMGKLRKFKKTEKGWRRVDARPHGTHINKVGRPKKAKVNKVTEAVRKPARPQRGGPRRDVRKFATRKQDLSDKKPVYIPKYRMTVYVELDADVEEVIKKYDEHYAWINKSKSW